MNRRKKEKERERKRLVRDSSLEPDKKRKPPINSDSTRNVSQAPMSDMGPRAKGRKPPTPLPNVSSTPDCSQSKPGTSSQQSHGSSSTDNNRSSNHTARDHSVEPNKERNPLSVNSDSTRNVSQAPMSDMGPRAKGRKPPTPLPNVSSTPDCSQSKPGTSSQQSHGSSSTDNNRSSNHTARDHSVEPNKERNPLSVNNDSTRNVSQAPMSDMGPRAKGRKPPTPLPNRSSTPDCSQSKPGTWSQQSSSTDNNRSSNRTLPHQPSLQSSSAESMCPATVQSRDLQLLDPCQFVDINENSVFETTLDVRVMDYFTLLLKRQFNVDYGLLRPSYLYAYVLQKDNLPESDKVPRGVFATQIHYLDGHYVVTCQERNTLTVYDSLTNFQRTNSILPQIEILYNFSKSSGIQLKYIVPQHQGISNDCGPFAVFNAYMLLSRRLPQNYTVKQNQLRYHLRKCFLNHLVSDFPIDSSLQSYFNYQNVLSARKQETTTNRNLNRSASISEKHNSQKQDKFSSQSHMSKNGKVQCPESTRIVFDTVSHRFVRQKNTNGKVSFKNEKEQLKKQIQSCLTSDVTNETIKEQMSDKYDRANKISQEQQVRRVVDRIHKNVQMSKHTVLDTDVISELKQNERKEKDRLRKRKERHSQTKEESVKSTLKDSIRKDKERKSQTKEESVTSKLKDSIRKDKERKRQTKEESVTSKLKDSIRKDKERKRQTKEKSVTSKLKDSIRKDKERQKETKKESELRKEKDRSHKIKQRHSETKEESVTSKLKDSIRKDKERQKETKKESELRIEKDRSHKIKQRHSETKEESVKSKLKDSIRKDKERHPLHVETAIVKFKTHITDAPEYICTVCHRTLFRNSVSKYSGNSDLSRLLSTDELSPNGFQYICLTCKRHISKNKIPPQAQFNKMSVPNPPPILSELTDFESRLLARRYPFMKIVQLPKGKQRGIMGRVVNVPVDASELCSSLPRTLSKAGILPVKLKRKRAYKGHVFYQNIRPDKIKQAFQWLLKNNRHYQNVVETPEWQTKCQEECEDTWQHFTEEKVVNENATSEEEQECDDNMSTSSSDSGSLSSDDDIIQLDAIENEESQFDTCVQPSDPAADASEIISIAPGEGQHPLHMMLDPGCEEQAFPQLFPTGCFGFDADREVKITPKKYFNARILNKSGEFAKNTEYLFFAQYVTEHKQVMDNVSIAVRKSYRSLPSEQSINAGFLQDPDRLKSLILKDKAYHFLQTVRGSPPYWQKAMYKLMAAVKQFGIFTFFLTFSSADLKWPDTINAILRQQGRHMSNEEINTLSWEQKCALLRSNPVTTARHFDHRLTCMFNDLLLSPAAVLGKVVHYSYRIEFQQRGSPHAHCILWIENAPKLSDPTEDIVQFIDKYITCSIPREEDNPELYNLVTTRQKHHHTATCKKKGTECRFNYPKLPSPCTVIAAPVESDDEVFKVATMETASDILCNVVQVLENDKDHKMESIGDLLTAAKTTIEQYVYALSVTKRGKTVLLKRQPGEIFINCYNSNLLLAWQANLDVQYCLDPYACIAYMVSYITKDEREMSNVLQNVTKEMVNHNWSDQLKSCANAFLNARELSAQEAVYRLLSLPLFKSNFTTIFVPADLPHKRVSFLKPVAAVREMEEEEEDVFTTSIIDRYSARPISLEDMCLAHFAVTYSPTQVASHTESNSDEASGDKDESTRIIQLRKDMGKMKRRKKKAVLRYHHKSSLKEPEEYFYSQLLLFLPWISEENELLNASSYEFLYNESIDTIEQNRAEVEHHTEIITKAVEQFHTFGPPVHAFDAVSSNTVQENEDEQGFDEDESFAILNPEEHMEKTSIPDDMPVAAANTTYSIEIRPAFHSEDQFYQEVRNLNAEQRETFQIVQKWCHEKSSSTKTGITPKPLLLFVSGGAGTGKSYLISAIFQMALRMFQREGENPEDIHVLLTAPTGTAAHNISGTTLHSAFLLPLGQTQSFCKLSDDKRNTLRSKLGNLELLIIDEISMVGSNLLLQLHYRLSEVKSDKQLFGGVSVIVLGDLYQLPPVKQKFVFKPVSNKIARLNGSLWTHFLFRQLVRIMRQKEDEVFAQLLNRIRTSTYTQTDIDVLSSRQIQDDQAPKDALYVYATNKDVDSHNVQELRRISAQNPVETIVAIDKKPKSLENYQPRADSKFTGGLPGELTLALGSRVMLIRNMDVSDGLVNGSQGKVVGFVRSSKSSSNTVLAVLVMFDSDKVGKATRNKSQFAIELKQCPGATPILRVEAAFTVAQKNTNLKITRYQFALKLCWACTIHKVQGLTLDKIVISFEHRFSPGQAYVALSRVKNLDGLHLLNFNEKKITASDDVKTEMKKLQMSQKCPTFYSFLTAGQSVLTVSVLNVRSYLRHEADILNDPLFNLSDVVILTETWLTQQSRTSKIPAQDYHVFRTDKPSHQNESHAGGVAVLTKCTSFLTCQEISKVDERFLQIITVKLSPKSTKPFYIIAVYNSPNVRNDLRACDAEIYNQVQLVRLFSGESPIMCTGDFNQNIFSQRRSHVLNRLSSEGFIQNVSSPTHSSGSCLDHVYTTGLAANCRTVPCYFSDHSWVTCSIKPDSDDMADGNNNLI